LTLNQRYLMKDKKRPTIHHYYTIITTLITMSVVLGTPGWSTSWIRAEKVLENSING
jgi:hypothetical protein